MKKREEKKNVSAWTNTKQSWKNRRGFSFTLSAGAESPPLSMSSLHIDPPLSHPCAYILLSESHPCIFSVFLHPVFTGEKKMSGHHLEFSLSLIRLVSISLTPPHLRVQPPCISHSFSVWASPCPSLGYLHIYVCCGPVSVCSSKWSRSSLDSEDGVCVVTHVLLTLHWAKEERERETAWQMEGQTDKDTMGRLGCGGGQLSNVRERCGDDAVWHENEHYGMDAGKKTTNLLSLTIRQIQQRDAEARV